MKLLRFRVTEFRSVGDSGWIECDDVTTLVGVNEAGKSNLLLALWKLNPAKGGGIDLLRDLPKKRYAELRDVHPKPHFIQADFEVTGQLLKKLQSSTHAEEEELCVARVFKDYSGACYVSFPNAKSNVSQSSSTIREIVSNAIRSIENLSESGKTELGIKEESIQVLNSCLAFMGDKDELSIVDLTNLVGLMTINAKEMTSSKIRPVFNNAKGELEKYVSYLDRPSPNTSEEAGKLVLSEIPSFVYYSNYGNLDSEIYLPYVIESLQRTDLTGVAEAKARTLRVLFDFVHLNPSEILELGKEPEPQKNQQGQIIAPITKEQIDQTAAKKTERDVLLQSASADLTSRFKEWWKQGNYIFDFRADGNYFRIWVSDDLRPEKVELEGRSTGLQWFLSFFLVFLVESKDAHKGAILLLDEAGLSLHPLAQRDLATFFENLAGTNQILHTTHSPFLIDTSHIDRVKLVYVNEEGYTVASNDLRAASQLKQPRSIYAVHAALGLSVSDVMLQGCYPVIVEGPSDQYYLSAIKNYLISEKLISPKEEMVFIPSGGVKGVEGIASIVSAKEEQMPVVFLDSDSSGRDFKAKLMRNLYKGLDNLVHEVREVRDMENAEIEDLIPYVMIQSEIRKLFRDVEVEDFDEDVNPSIPLVPQIQAFATKHKVNLPTGWKVDTARAAKQRLLRQRDRVLSPEYISFWTALFERLTNP